MQGVQLHGSMLDEEDNFGLGYDMDPTVHYSERSRSRAGAEPAPSVLRRPAAAKGSTPSTLPSVAGSQGDKQSRASGRGAGGGRGGRGGGGRGGGGNSKLANLQPADVTEEDRFAMCSRMQNMIQEKINVGLGIQASLKRCRYASNAQKEELKQVLADLESERKTLGEIAALQKQSLPGVRTKLVKAASILKKANSLIAGAQHTLQAADSASQACVN